MGALTWAGSTPAVAATRSLTVSPSAPMVGERFTVSTRLTTSFAREARLQWLSGSSWKTISTKRTSSTGYVRFTSSTSLNTKRLRVHAPAVTHRSKRYSAQQSSSRLVQTIAVPVVSPSTPMVKETFTVSTRFATRFSRTAQLQWWTGSGWRTVSSIKTSSLGYAKFSTWTSLSSKSFRIYAPAVRRGSTWYSSQRSGTSQAQTVAQEVTHALQAGAVDGALSASVTALPARSGRQVTLQESTADGPWVDVATAATSSSGTVTFEDARSAQLADGRRYRAVASEHNGAPSESSPPSEFVQAPIGVTVDTVVGEDGAITLEAETTGGVSKVRFFVDGTAVAEDESSPWQVPWESTAGRHEIMARVFGPAGTAVSDAVVMTIPASLGIDEVSGLSEGFSIEPVAAGFDLPTSFAVVDLATIFVSEKSGIVKMFGMDEGEEYSQPVTVLDIRDKVLTQQDRGLVGLAVDPDFGSNGYLYVSYVLDDGTGNAPNDERAEQAQRVERYTYADGAIDPASAHTVLGSVTGPACYAEENVRTPDCLPVAGFGHTVGDLAFDADDNLLIGVGDGAFLFADLDARTASFRAQDPEVLAGKILRVDKETGRGVPDNPFYVGDGSSNASRVLALGLRNPFRITVGDDGMIVTGDVGEVSFEEINHVVPGANYGWPCLEGDAFEPVDWTECDALRQATGDDALKKPTYSYRFDGGGSVTGGVFYTGDAYPEEYQGRYFFGDYAQNFIRTARMTDQGELSGSVYQFAGGQVAGGPVKFVMGPDDQIWYLSIYSGELRQIVYTGDSASAVCSQNSFLTSYFDLSGEDSALNAEYDEYGWWKKFASVTLAAEPSATRCQEAIHLEPTSGSPFPPHVPDDQFGIRWQGRVLLAGGTYTFTATSSDWMRLRVDGVVEHNWFASRFWADNGVANTHTVRLSEGVHNIAAELISDGGTASADVTWERVGSAPSVQITTPDNGVTIDAGGSVAYTVTASDAEDPEVSSDDVTVVADLMHFDGNAYHLHPVASSTGASGSFTLSDDHAPAHSMFRLTGRVTDDSGEQGISAPVYVCLVGNEVGPCALQ